MKLHSIIIVLVLTILGFLAVIAAPASHVDNDLEARSLTDGGNDESMPSPRAMFTIPAFGECTNWGRMSATYPHLDYALLGQFSDLYHILTLSVNQPMARNKGTEIYTRQGEPLHCFALSPVAHQIRASDPRDLSAGTEEDTALRRAQVVLPPPSKWTSIRGC